MLNYVLTPPVVALIAMITMHADPGVVPEAQLETLDLTVTERADGFRVAPDGEPYTP